MAEAIAERVGSLGATGFAGRSRISMRKAGGRFLPRHTRGLDPGLAGEAAFEHPAVEAWWRWLVEEYTPHAQTALVTPCSNVKPYTRSPTSRKIRGLLRRLGLWDESASKPRRLAWLYLSDLLLLVPYERAEEYPACCYEVPPDLVLNNERLYRLVTSKLAHVLQALYGRGLRRVVLFLPRKHMRLWSAAYAASGAGFEVISVGYHIFQVYSRLEPVLREVVRGRAR